MDNPETQATMDTRHRTKKSNTIKHNTINTKQSWVIRTLSPPKKNEKKTSKNNNTKRRLRQVLTKSKKFLLLIRHPLCYSYGQDFFDITICK
jgi:hypothetical protein